ncbi:hypothetical protein GUJ93_ZPchr0010g10594 [Zizania palustris]|uniref:BCAS3 domain-containing protein n=1 Tax=Zizania palustris TaxID=103762 RepID=A0A8J5W8Z0_ZIZPA|nr:hypothetical protein GUJ93_ZPchr0010g10594 [Zizania palustris]
MLLDVACGVGIYSRFTELGWFRPSAYAAAAARIFYLIFHIQDDELHVTAEPIQWWDVCRRTTWPERDENIANIIFHYQQSSMVAKDASACDTEHSDSIISDGLSGKYIMRARERSSWYLSNAEVQISSWRIPIWQKSKIFFYVLGQPTAESRESVDLSVGEIEIEKRLFMRFELQRRELLPVFKQLHHDQRFSDSVQLSMFSSLPVFMCSASGDTDSSSQGKATECAMRIVEFHDNDRACLLTHVLVSSAATANDPKNPKSTAAVDEDSLCGVHPTSAYCTHMNLAIGRFPNASVVDNTQYSSTKDNDAHGSKPAVSISGFYNDTWKMENMNGTGGQIFSRPITADDLHPMEK